MITRLAGALALVAVLVLLVIASNAGRPTVALAASGGDSTHRGPLTAADSAAALEKLVSDLTAITAIPEAKTGKVGVQVRSITHNRVLYSLNPDSPLTPASTTKVVTSFTALSELGANYEVRTILAADAKPNNGVIKGNLYLKGFGDPFLSANEIDELVDQLANSGVRQIDGAIVGDGSFFDNKTERTQYSGDKEVVVPLPPIAALTLNQGTFTVVVSSMRIAGAPLNVQTFPGSAGFEIVNTATTAAAPVRKAGGKRGRKHAAYDYDSPANPATADHNGQARYGDEHPMPLLPTLDERKPNKNAKGTAPKRGSAQTKRPARTAAKASAPSSRRGTAVGKQQASSRQSTARQSTARQSTARQGTARRGKPAVAATPVRGNTRGTKAGTASPRPAVAAKPAAAPPQPAATPQPAGGRGPLRVTLTGTADGRQVITVSGSMPPGRTASYRFAMKNPPLVIAGMVYNRLRSRGITINGGVTTGVTPAKYRMLASAGRPLQEILQLVLKNSNNFLAEYVFKMIGGAAGGQDETARKTLERIQGRMNACRVPFGRCIINDGSGLSRNNCLTASALVGILDAAHADKKVFEPFYRCLSIAGVDGTLRRRMKGTYAERNVHGKTGTLNNVSALAGYVTTRDGEVLCFSMLMNGKSGGYHAVQDRVAARLAAFSYRDVPTAPVGKAP